MFTHNSTVLMTDSLTDVRCVTLSSSSQKAASIHRRLPLPRLLMQKFLCRVNDVVLALVCAEAAVERGCAPFRTAAGSVIQSISLFVQESIQDQDKRPQGTNSCPKYIKIIKHGCILFTCSTQYYSCAHFK